MQNQNIIQLRELELLPDDAHETAFVSTITEKGKSKNTKKQSSGFDVQKARDIFDVIDNARGIMLVMHQGPDGDTAGSALGFAHYFDSIEKPHVIYCKDKLPEYLGFLPGKEKITNDPSVWDATSAPFDVVITVDGGDLGYLGVDGFIDELRTADHAFTLINIDHHATNKDFGDINYVIRHGSSTCEIVHDLLAWRGGLTKKSSECLMTGLITDTGHFMNLATTASAVGAASGLLRKGLNLTKLSTHTMRNRSFATLKLWGIALERLTETPQGLVYTVITKKDIERTGANDDDVGGVSNFLNSLDQTHEAKAILVLREEDNGMVKGSMRTTRPDIDVSKTAVSFGGGGHKKAAGFSVQGALTQQEDGHWAIISNEQ